VDSPNVGKADVDEIESHEGEDAPAMAGEDPSARIRRLDAGPSQGSRRS
jgi:hypothetical protein